jgi:hypothetical protein
MWWKYLCISSYTRNPFLIYDFAPVRSHLNYPIYEENFVFFFISVSTSFHQLTLFLSFFCLPLCSFIIVCFCPFCVKSTVCSTVLLEFNFLFFAQAVEETVDGYPTKGLRVSLREQKTTKKKHWHVIKRTTRDENLGSSRFFYCSV